MKKLIIKENERALLFKNGRFICVLGSGKHRLPLGATAEVLSTEMPIQSANAQLNTLLENEDFRKLVTVYDIVDGQLGVQYLNGRFCGVLPRGSFAYFNTADDRRVDVIDVTSPEIVGVPDAVIAKLPTHVVTKITVDRYETALLFFDGRYVRTLQPGTYTFWKNDVKVSAEYGDMRLTPLDVSGQEMLTRDKVTLRVSFVCNYRVTNLLRAVTEVGNYSYQIYTAAQLALREYVGSHRLDEILENKQEMSAQVCARLKEKQESFFVEISDGDVKDIILPGEIRSIMNTVLVAEKRAQANVITRREEVASTRSLLNTAKLMEENATLYKLKELEYIERICEKVGNINLSSNGDLLGQLANALAAK